MYNIGKNWIHDLIFKHIKLRKKKMSLNPDWNEAKFYQSWRYKQICIANKIMHYNDNFTIDF